MKFNLLLTTLFSICLDKMSHKINLKCHDIKEDMKNSFESFMEKRDFVDVSLVCEDGKQVEAHKVILFSYFLHFVFVFNFFLTR